MNNKTLTPCFLDAFEFWIFNTLKNSGYSAEIGYILSNKYNHSICISTKTLPKQLNINISTTGWNFLKY